MAADGEGVEEGAGLGLLPAGLTVQRPWITADQRKSNIAMLTAMAAVALAEIAETSPSYSYVACLRLMDDCIRTIGWTARLAEIPENTVANGRKGSRGFGDS